MSEKVYDEEISPLMKKIIEICKRENMPIFATIEFDEGEFCTTRIPGEKVMFQYIDAVMQSCIGTDGFNIDKFMFWIIRSARERGHSSLVLSQLDIPITPEPPTESEE